MAFSTHDQVPDSPTNVFATANLLDLSGGTLSDGNLRFISDGGWDGVRASFSYDYTNKYYLEVFVEARATGVSIGVLKSDVNILGDLGNSSSAYVYNSGDGSIYNNGSSTSYGNSYGTGNIIGVLWDNGSVYFYKDGTIQNSGTAAVTSLTGTWAFAVNVNGSDKVKLNFGQDPSFGAATGLPTAPSGSPFTDANGIGSFYYQPPTGALALCTANLPDPAIDPALDDLPEDYFKAVKYIGNNATWQDNPDGQDVTVGFQPDLVWWKNRDSSVAGHYISDTVRGITELMNPSSTTSQTAFDTTHKQTYGYITQINSNGFRIAKGTSTASVETNSSSNNYIAWCFRAGGSPSGSTSTTGSAKRINTSGTQDDTSCDALASAASATITPTLMSINQKAGFSIVKYNTGQTGHLTGGPYSIPHGLGAEPTFIVIKSLDNAYDWLAYHKSVNNVNYAQLNGSNAFTTADTNTYPGSNTEYVVNIGGTQVIAADGDYIMYSWAPVKGFSAFGSYTGNGSADGPFIYTGFKPSFLIIKDTTSAGGWFILDNARNQYNPVNSYLMAQSSGAEDPNNSTVDYDFVSNGIKVRATSTNLNTNNNVYIFMSFAQTPFKYSATNAR